MGTRRSVPISSAFLDLPHSVGLNGSGKWDIDVVLISFSTRWIAFGERNSQPVEDCMYKLVADSGRYPGGKRSGACTKSSFYLVR